MERHTMLLDCKSPYYQNDYTIQGSLRVNAIPIKLPRTFFTELEQNILKFVWKHRSTKDPEWPKTSRKRKMDLEESGSRTSDYTTKQQSSKLYGTGTKTEIYISATGQKAHAEFNPCTYRQLIYDKGGKNIQWRKDSLFNRWCWENWTATWKRMKLEHSLTPHTKINSKWIKDLDIRPDAIKLLEENLGQTLSDKNDSNIFSDPPLRVMTVKTKINKWDLIKLKGSAQQMKP